MTLNGAGKDSKYVDEDAPPDWTYSVMGSALWADQPLDQPGSTRINQINPIQALQDFGLFPGEDLF